MLDPVKLVKEKKPIWLDKNKVDKTKIPQNKTKKYTYNTRKT